MFTIKDSNSKIISNKTLCSAAQFWAFAKTHGILYILVGNDVLNQLPILTVADI